MVLVRFYAFIIWLGIMLAFCGELKSCTLAMMGKAAQSSEQGIMSYSEYTRLLTK